jgi:hypothetical protein
MLSAGGLSFDGRGVFSTRELEDLGSFTAKNRMDANSIQLKNELILKHYEKVREKKYHRLSAL